MFDDCHPSRPSSPPLQGAVSSPLRSEARAAVQGRRRYIGLSRPGISARALSSIDNSSSSKGRIILPRPAHRLLSPSWKGPKKGRRKCGDRAPPPLSARAIRVTAVTHRLHLPSTIISITSSKSSNARPPLSAPSQDGASSLPPPSPPTPGYTTPPALRGPSPHTPSPTRPPLTANPTPLSAPPRYSTHRTPPPAPPRKVPSSSRVSSPALPVHFGLRARTTSPATSVFIRARRELSLCLSRFVAWHAHGT